MEKLTVDYTTIKNLLGKLPSYYVLQGDGGYSIYCVGDSLFIQSRLLGQETASISDFNTNYKSLCTSTYSSDDALVLGNIANNIPLVQPRTTTGLIRTSSEKTEISKKNFFSHNWCDKTTWYTDSVRVVDEIAVNSGDNKTYHLNDGYIIDVSHGKLFLEDFLKDSNGNSYKISVKVNDVEVEEVDPHDNQGDYLVDYVLGKITFTNTLNALDIVKVTYYYATTSTFIIKPDQNKKLNISIAEVQFSQDIILNDAIVFQPFGYVDIFAPHLVGALGSGTKIPLEDPVIYKTIGDFQCDAFKAYPAYPKLSESTWRGMPQPLLVFDWDYISSTSIYEKYGMEIRVSLQHHEPFGGYYASASFYCMTETF